MTVNTDCYNTECYHINGELCGIIRHEQIVLCNTVAFDYESIFLNKCLSTGTCVNIILSNPLIDKCMDVWI